MANVDLLISKLDKKLKSLHQEQSMVAKANKTGILEPPLLAEYVRLATTDGTIPGIDLIALDALSNHFNLYEDDRERQQIFAVRADELNDSTDSDILASIQTIHNIYPSIYLLAQDQLILTKGRATKEPKVDQVDRSDPPFIKGQPEAGTLKESQTKSGLLIAFCIISAILGGAIVNSFNKSPNLASPTAANSPQPIATGVRSSSVENSNSVPISTVATPKTRPSPAQAIRDHYQALNDRNYDTTWDNLTSRFKSASGNSSTLARKEYEDWWNSVRSVDLQRVETSSISSDGNRAVVNYRHGYTMNGGRFVQDKHTRLFLVWDEGKGKWLIDKRI